MAEIQDLSLALQRQVAKKIYNTAFSTPSFVSLLFALDNFYMKSPVKRIDPYGIEGGDMRINFQVSQPVVRGVNRNGTDFSQRIIPLQANAETIAGSIAESAYEFLEAIDRYKINRLKGDKMLSEFVKLTAAQCADAWITKINSDFWPSTQQVGGTGQYAQSDKIMAFAYPLQTGFSGNAATGTGTYSYLGIDLNTRTNIKALNYGTDSQGVTPTIGNLRQNLIMPLRQRGAKVDLMIAGSADYEYLINQADAEVRLSYEKELEFGGTYVKLEDIFVIYEPMIDLLPKSEIYVGDSSTLRVGMDGDNKDRLKSFSVIDPFPQAPSMVAIQGYNEICFVNENPRYWGRAYNTVRS